MEEIVRPKFAVFDIDGTIIRWQLYHAIVGQLSKQGSLTPEVASQIRQARMVWKKRTAQDSFRQYEQVLVNKYTQALTSISPSNFEAAVEEVFEAYKDQVYTFTRDLIRDLKSKNYLLFAISGSQQQIIEKFGNYYGFDDVVGSEYEVINNQFTGKAKIPTLEGKGSILRQLVEKHRAIWSDSLAVGDTRSDAQMLELVAQPIAFNPDRELFEIAQKMGWKMVVERKNVVYELVQNQQKYELSAE